MILLIFCLINLFNIYLYFSKKHHLFILLSLIILFIEPIFQKLIDLSLYGATYNVFGFDRLKSNLIIIAGFILILIINKSKSNLPSSIMKPINRYVLFVIIFHAFNIMFSHNLTNSLAITIVSILGPILFFYILLMLPSEVYFDNSSILKSIYISVILFLLIGIYMYNYTLSQGEISDIIIVRTGGGMWLSNISTQILALFFPFTFSKVQFRFSKIIKVLVILLFIVLLGISMSRTALVVYSIMLLLIFSLRKKKIVFILIVLSLFFSLLKFSKQIFKVDIVELYTQRFIGEGDVLEAAKDDARFEIYREGIEIAKGNEIIGTGISSFGDLNKNGYSNVHNILLNIFIERGLIGLLLFIIFLFYFFLVNKKGTKTFLVYENENEFFRLIRIGVIGFFLIGLTGNDMFINSGFVNGWATYLLLFLLAIQIKKINSSKAIKNQIC